MNHGSEPGHASQLRFTPKQGQYLAFIHAYMLVLGRPPAEADLRRHFRVTPPSVHQMLVTLEPEVFTSHDLNAESFLAVVAGWPVILCPCRDSQIGGDVIRFGDVHRDRAQPDLAACGAAAGELP
jgi:hypothetical protein